MAPVFDHLPGRKFLDEELVRAIAVVRLAFLEHLARMRRPSDVRSTSWRNTSTTRNEGRTALVVPPGYLSEINFRWFLSQLFDVAQGDIYLVRPEGTFEIDEPRITVLDGSDTYIPLRDGHIDNLVLVWVPRPRRGSARSRSQRG